MRLTSVVLALALVAACSKPAPPDEATDRVAIDIADQRFDLELALTVEQRFQGLSDRESIAADGGMMFVFPDEQAGIQTFVMRRCLVPIDIIFLDPQGRVVAMHEMKVEPYDTPDERMVRYPSRYPAQFAIELAGGTLRSLGLSAGDRIEFDRAGLKARAR